jgi:sigma-B regulation protein RsbU (phosphoserine phosphatase)
MKELGDYAIKTSSRLGVSAVKDSKSALSEQFEKELLALARDQAYITNILLQRIASEVETSARIYGEICKNSKEFDKVQWDSVSKVRPADINAFSCYSAAPGVSPVKLEENLRALSRMHNLFKFIYAGSQYIKLIYIGTESGVFFEYPWKGHPQNFDPRGRPWYQKAINTDSIVWVGPYVSATDNKLVLSCSRAVYGADGKAIGAVGVDVTVEVISNDFISTQLERNGFAFLLDSKGNVLAREGLDDKKLRWDDKSFKAENLLKSSSAEFRDLGEKMTKGALGLHKITPENGQAQFVAYAPVPAANWSIGIAMPLKDVIAPAVATEKEISNETIRNNLYIAHYIKDRQIIYLAICFGLIFIVIIVGFVISGRITGPIQKLGEGARIIGNGNLDKKLEIRTGDEIEDLAKIFNKMTDDLKLYIKDLKDTVEAKERFERELKVARDIQYSMLPGVFPAFPDRKEFDIFAMMTPAKDVGGDFYDFFFIDENRLFLCIGDVSGKGMPAALFMAMTKTLLKGAALNGQSPRDILFNVNNALEKDNNSCMFATVFCAILNVSTGELLYSNAGHNRPLLSDGKAFEFMQMPSGCPVGPFPMTENKFQDMKTSLEPGAFIFLYTDGVTEAMNSKYELFSDAKLRDTLNGLFGETSSGLVEKVRTAVDEHAAGEPQSDDITMLALEMKINKEDVI